MPWIKDGDLNAAVNSLARMIRATVSWLLRLSK
jgi:hypothetical protein